MVDRIERPDSPLHRIVETDRSGDEEKQRRQLLEEEEKKKDSFGEKPPWEKIITKPIKARGSNPLLTKEELSRSMMRPDDEEEESWTWRLRHQPLVALGILDIDAKPRWGMIATYLLGLGGLVVSTLLLVRVFYP